MFFLSPNGIYKDISCAFLISKQRNYNVYQTTTAYLISYIEYIGLHINVHESNEIISLSIQRRHQHFQLRQWTRQFDLPKLNQVKNHGKYEMFEIEKCIFNTQKRLGSIENIFHINQNYLSVTVPHPLSPITMASIKKVFSIFFAQSLKKESRAFINIINLRSIRCVAPHRCEFVQIPCTTHSPPSHFYVALYTPPIDG